MGCGSSKRTAVMPVGDSVGEDVSAGGPTRRTSELPALEGEDPPAEQLREESVRPSMNNAGNREHIGLYWGNDRISYLYAYRLNSCKSGLTELVILLVT
jgi:hypothetical protein